jgi:hypothetical protein
MLSIKADITFIKKQKTKPYYDSSAITGLVPKLYFKTEKKNVLISNARNLKSHNFETTGFEICKFSSKYNLSNISNNLENYKNELNVFLKKKFGYLDSFIFDLTRRSNSSKGAKNQDGNRQPAERAHVDYTENSGKKRAEDILGKNYFKEITNSKKRIIQLNLWRPLCKTVLSSPLAFALPASILKKDLVATDQIFPDRIGEIYHLSYNKNQKWFWVPNMKETEILLLKGWDNFNNRKILKFTPHTAFNLQNQNIKKNPRDSIEARVFLVLKK